ncbi:MAG: competence protein ComEC [Verrucomicrobiota bacterium]|jgi:hypothetical protein
MDCGRAILPLPSALALRAARITIDPMKSAYELAMERLEKKGPSMALTDDQKAQIAEVDSTFKARIAERELFLKAEIRKAQDAGKVEEADSLQKQLAVETRRLQGDAEAKKDKLRTSFSQ